MRVVTAAVSFALVLSALAAGQSEFDVATIKPSQSRVSDFRFLPGGRLTITNQTLEVIIQEAWKVHRYEIAGLPEWARSERWDITAETEGNPKPEQMEQMLRTLLEQRFSLKIRRDTKEGTIYALITAKNGPKLPPPKDTSQSFIHMFREGAPTEAAISIRSMAGP